MATRSTRINFAAEIETAWGPARIATDDVELLSELTGTRPDECIERLSSYRVDEMAVSWRQQNPETPDEIGRFYSTTDLYLWELLAWNGSAEYERYLRQLDRLAEVFPPERYPTVLDYGSGVGTAAAHLAELGYRVTIADVPSRTLDFARARLASRRIPCSVIEIIDAVPDLPVEHWDVVVCLDVLEHVTDPAAVGRSLVRALAPGGGACVAVTFDMVDAQWPHHLPTGYERFRGHRWPLYFQSLGMRYVDGWIYQKVDRRSALLRRLRYMLWRATGLYVQRYPQ
jgi:2-polyprenyl-3-methyl-5-hydroxy-6-metoxy-1,4-benzoquinol methylase